MPSPADRRTLSITGGSGSRSEQSGAASRPSHQQEMPSKLVLCTFITLFEPEVAAVAAELMQTCTGGLRQLGTGSGSARQPHGVTDGHRRSYRCADRSVRRTAVERSD